MAPHEFLAGPLPANEASEAQERFIRSEAARRRWRRRCRGTEHLDLNLFAPRHHAPCPGLKPAFQHQNGTTGGRKGSQRARAGIGGYGEEMGRLMQREQRRNGDRRGAVLTRLPVVGPAVLPAPTGSKGVPAACMTSDQMTALSGASSEGFSTMVQPAAMAGTSLQAI
jgi:hypothetical protein